MRASTPLVALMLVSIVFTGHPSAQSGVSTGADAFVAGEILVTFRPGADGRATADAHRQAGGTLLAEVPRIGVQRVAVPAGSESATIARYRRNPNVLHAEPNYIRTIPVPASHAPGTQVVPGDYYFREQWGLHNIGQLFLCIPWIGGHLCFYVGTPDADIDAPEAWAISTGDPGVTVAVIDSGVDYTHPDLAANYAGGDDFIEHDGDPMDDHGHGTHVSGIIAGAMDNLTGDSAEGIVGVAPRTRLLAYKACASDGTCNDFAIVEAVGRAVEDGARVINMSLGGPEPSAALETAIQHAWSAGVVIVASAGNAGTTAPVYPAAFDSVVSVAAFDEDHRRPPFSTYGSWVDLSAPGNVIMSTYPMFRCGGGSDVPGDTGCYTWLSGTSMAAPYVSGAAALVWSRPDVTTNAQVVDILLRSADPVGVDGEVRLDAWTAYGGLNVHDALSYGLTNRRPVANAGPDQTVTDADGDGVELVALDGSGSFDPDGTIVSCEWLVNETLVGVGVAPTVMFAVGTHHVTLRVTDDGGDSGTDTVTITVEPAPEPPSADTVTLIRLSYNNGRRQLTVEATSTGAPAVALTAFDNSDPSNHVELGPLVYNAKRARYAQTFDVASRPASVLVVSTGGGTGSGLLGGK